MNDQASEHDKWIDNVVDHVNQLIQLDFDAALTYREALEHVDEAAVRFDLETFLRDHERHIMELSGIVRDLGGTPVEGHRDFKGAVMEVITRLRSRGGTLGALRAMRMVERLTNRRYDHEAEVYMPPIAQAIVLENLNDERRHLAAIEAHIDRLSGRAYYDAERAEREAQDRRQPPVI